MWSRIVYVWERYQWNLKHRPYRPTRTASTISMFGDALAQSVFKRFPTPTDNNNQDNKSSQRQASPPLPRGGASSSPISTTMSLTFVVVSSLVVLAPYLGLHFVVDVQNCRSRHPCGHHSYGNQKGMITDHGESTNLSLSYITTADHCFVKGASSPIVGQRWESQEQNLE